MPTENPDQRAMHVQSIKARVARADYVVDPAAVAEAHAAAQRPRHAICWPPGRSDGVLIAGERTARSAPARLSAGAARRVTRPTHVDALGRRARAPSRRTARSPRRRSRPAPPAGTPSCAATSATPGASGSAARSISMRTPLRRARWPASVAIPSLRSISACAPAARERAALAPGAAAGAGRRRPARPARRARPSSTASPAAGAAERAGDADAVARPRAVAARRARPRRRPSRRRSPTSVSAGARVTSPPRSSRRSRAASASMPRTHCVAASAPKPSGMPIAT